MIGSASPGRHYHNGTAMKNRYVVTLSLSQEKTLSLKMKCNASQTLNYYNSLQQLVAELQVLRASCILAGAGTHAAKVKNKQQSHKQRAFAVSQSRRLAKSLSLYSELGGLLA